MDRYVKPGEELGVEEEFTPGSGTFVENGIIYACTSGKLATEGKTLSIEGRSNLKKLKVGDLVIGSVENVKEPIALVLILGIDEKGQRHMISSDYSVLHASKVKDGFVKNIHEEIKIGDLILARVDEERADGFALSINDKDLGVIKGFCVRCRGPLELRNFNLVCEKCGHKEYRKISSKYRGGMV